MEFKSINDKAWYAVGVSVAKTLHHIPFLDLNLNAVCEGIKDGLAGKPQLSPEDVTKAYIEANAKLAKKQAKDWQQAQNMSATYLEKYAKYI